MHRQYIVEPHERGLSIIIIIFFSLFTSTDSVTRYSVQYRVTLQTSRYSVPRLLTLQQSIQFGREREKRDKKENSAPENFALNVIIQRRRNGAEYKSIYRLRLKSSSSSRRNLISLLLAHPNGNIQFIILGRQAEIERGYLGEYEKLLLLLYIMCFHARAIYFTLPTIRTTPNFILGKNKSSARGGRMT